MNAEFAGEKQTKIPIPAKLSLTRSLGPSRCFDHLVMADTLVGIRVLREELALQIIRQGQAENFQKELAAPLGF